MAHINHTKKQTIHYYLLINLQNIHPKFSISCQKQSMNVYLEIPPMENSLIHLNINTKNAKSFLQLLRQHLPPSNKLHKIFNQNTAKVSYCCTQNVALIVKSHNRKLINTSIKHLCHIIAGRSMIIPQMANAELRILCINALPQQTGTLTRFIQVYYRRWFQTAFLQPPDVI